MKRFKILSDRYRNRRKRFGLRLNPIAGIYNYELVLGLCKKSNGNYPTTGINEAVELTGQFQKEFGHKKIRTSCHF